MGITAPLRARPFFTGTSTTSAAVPYRYPVSLDGRNYMIDTNAQDPWVHETVPLLRQQSDSASAPGEASLNPEGLWRRSWASWHKGSGQPNRDREDSLAFRYRESRGVDPWGRYELDLLPAVDQKRTSSNTNLKLAVCGNRLFLIDGQNCVYTEDITTGTPTFTACNGEPAATLLDIASDGRNVYITDGANVYDAVAADAPPDFTTAWSTQDVDSLAFVKGRLVGGHDDDLWTFAGDGTATQITVAGILPANFTWVGFAGGPSNAVIYAAGHAGDKSMIYRIGIKDDGTGLDVAIPAGELPDGETVRAIASYLGFVLLGTDTGVRFATPDANGDLTIGALLATGSPCRCFEGQEQYVWFGWDEFIEDTPDHYDWHGLGRLSLEEFSSADRLAPAYATDMMTRDDGAVSSVVTFQDRRVWCIEGTSMGVYAEEAGPCADGYLWTGQVDFGFTGTKTAMEVDFAFTNPAGGAVAFSVSVDGAEAVPAGTVSSEATGLQSFPVGPLRGSHFDVLIRLTKGTTLSPTLTSYTLKASPAAEGTVMIQVPLLFHEHFDPDGGVEYLSVQEERNAVDGWWNTRQPIVYQELLRTHRVTVEDYRWVPTLRQDDTDGFAVDGTMVLRLKEAT